MRRIVHLLSYTLEFIVVICLTTTIITTFLQVFYRHVLKNPLPWSQEVLMISFVYFVLFGAALAIKHKTHLKVDLVTGAPEKIQRILKAFEFSAIFIFTTFFVYYGMILVMNNLKSGQVVGFLPLQVAYVYLSIPISGLFMLYYLVKGSYK